MEHWPLRRKGARAAEHVTNKGGDLEGWRLGGVGTGALRDLRRERVPHSMKLEVEALHAARVAGGLVSKGRATRGASGILVGESIRRKRGR